MSTTVSPQVRVLALVGVLVAVAAGLTAMALSRIHNPSAAPAKAIKPLHAVQKNAAAPSKTGTRAMTPKTATKPAAVKPAVKPKPVRTVAANGLPMPIAVALRKHSVVVVALYQPTRIATAGQLDRAMTGASADGAIGIDRFSLAEAAAGARDAGAGFVGINVLSERQAKPLASLFGILEDPAVLVFTKTGQLSVRLGGFSDRITVAQAAANAKS